MLSIIKPNIDMGKKATLYFVNILITIATLILFIFSILGKIASGLNAHEYMYMALFTLAQPLVSILNLILLIYWSVKLKFKALIPLTAILININLIASIIQINFTSEDKPYDIKIASYNVNFFRYNGDKNRHTVYEIASFMKNENVDILCIQEFYEPKGLKRSDIDSIFGFMPYVYAPKRVDRNGNNRLNLAIFSKYPITDSLNITFENTANNNIFVDIVAKGRKIRIFNNHLQTTNINQSKKEIESLKTYNFNAKFKNNLYKLSNKLHDNFLMRTIQAEKVISIIDTTDIDKIVCGDFNDTPFSFVYHIISENITDGFKSAGSGYCYSYRHFYNLLRIDYIFHDNKMKGIKYYSPNLPYSDHKPVLLEVALGN